MKVGLGLGLIVLAAGFYTSPAFGQMTVGSAIGDRPLRRHPPACIAEAQGQSQYENKPEELLCVALPQRYRVHANRARFLVQHSLHDNFCAARPSGAQ